MRKCFKYAMMLVAVVMSAVVISSCSKDDDETSSGSSSSSSSSSGYGLDGFYVYSPYGYPDMGMEISGSLIQHYTCSDAAHKSDYNVSRWYAVSGVSNLYRSAVERTERILAVSGNSIYTSEGGTLRKSGTTIYIGSLPYKKVK